MTGLEFTNKYNELYSLMFAFALRLTNDTVRARDLVQEASYKAFKNRASFRKGTNFKAWLSTILRNTFINDYRKKKVRKLSSEPMETLVHQMNQHLHASNEGESNLRLEEFYQLFQKLDSKYSIPFLMLYKGYRYDEIATTLSIPVGTVKSRIHTARAKLRTMLKH